MKDKALRVLTSLGENWRTIAKVLVAVVLVLVIFPLIAHSQPWLAGADQSYVVESGSMEPNITTGSLIWVEENVSASQIEEGDVITFSKGRGTKTTTHRVHEKQTTTVDNSTTYKFITKGDANEEPDTEPVFAGDIEGRMVLSLPYLGYIVWFTGTKLGWFVLFIGPVFLLFGDGLWTLWKALEFEDEEDS